MIDRTQQTERLGYTPSVYNTSPPKEHLYYLHNHPKITRTTPLDTHVSPHYYIILT